MAKNGKTIKIMSGTALCKYCRTMANKNAMHEDEHTKEHYHQSCRPSVLLKVFLGGQKAVKTKYGRISIDDLYEDMRV